MIKEKIIKKLGIEQLNEMQQLTEKTLLHDDGDAVVLSPTGSGKTLAYLLPLVQQLSADTDSLQAVVLVPGRELAQQSAHVLSMMGTGLRGMALYGGRPTMDEHRLLRQLKPHVVFATPGRFNDHLDKENLETNLVEWLIIDEFDKCLQMGFQDEMNRAIARLVGVRRRVLLSATDAEEIPSFVNMAQTKRIDLLGNEDKNRVTIFSVKSPERDKLETLSRLLRWIGQGSSVVFLNHRESVERAVAYLREQGFVVSLFHGGLEQRQREQALHLFSNGSANVMVCTDLASRGLDIPDIQNIIHYHMPETQDAYVHRVGRTARWDKSGRTFFILAPGESVPSYVKPIPENCDLPLHLPQPQAPLMVTLYIGKGKKDKISKGDILGFLCKKGGLTSAEIGRIDVYERYVYVAVARERLNKVLTQTKGEKIKGLRTVIELVK